jgi:hypothetical protein
MDGQEAVRIVGGDEGAGYLEQAAFGVIFHFPALAGGGFLVYQFNLYGGGVKAGGVFTVDEPVKVNVVDGGKAFQYLPGRLLGAVFKVIAMGP